MDVMPHAARKRVACCNHCRWSHNKFHHGGKLPQNKVDQREFSRFHLTSYVSSTPLASSTM